MPIRSRTRAIARTPHGFALAALTAALAAALLVAASPAPAATPCWMRVVQDWYADERIDRTYPRHCYRDALRNVPEEVLVYTSFEEAVRIALQRKDRNVRTPAAVGVGPDEENMTSRTARRGGEAAQPRRELFKEAFDKLGPREADGMPLPLLILGGMALLLIAAGAGGLLRRHLKARRIEAR